MMRECSYRKGCWQMAYGDSKLCYRHEKLKNPPEPPGNIRDQFSSEALAIAEAERLLSRERSRLRG
jgi:hypothetical protein